MMKPFQELISFEEAKRRLLDTIQPVEVVESVPLEQASGRVLYGDITAQSDCWLQAYRSGQKIVEKIIKPGEHIHIPGYELLLNIGNPSTLSISINGEEITRYRKQTRPLRIRISPQNLNSFF